MIRVGLIGCGNMAHGHAELFSAVGDRARIVAAVDVDETRAAKVAELAGGAEAATDYRDVLDKIDAALLVLPHHLHHAVAKDCLEAGKHVLVEKPLANTEEECLDLIETSQRCGRVLMVAYPLRYWPIILELKKLIDEKTYGDLFHMAIWTEQYTRLGPDHWMSDAGTLGGGQLFSHGCHYIDLLLWFLGEPVQGLHMGSNFGTEWMEKEGTSNIVMKFESGAMGYHFGTWGARGSKLRYSIHMHCTGGMLEAKLKDGPPQLILHRLPGTDAWPPARTTPADHEYRRRHGSKQTLLFKTDLINSKQTDKEMSHFLDCIEQGRKPETGAEGSLQGLRVIWGLYEAEQKGVIADLRGLGLP